MKIRLARIVGSCCGIGYLPGAPGTWASVFGLGLFALWSGEPVVAGFVLLVITLSAFLLGRSFEAAFSSRDPKPVVLDEVAGMGWVVFGLDGGWPSWIAGFVLFRFFDIWKPFPVRRFERLPHGWGIMADDFLAALLARVALELLRAVNVFA